MTGVLAIAFGFLTIGLVLIAVLGAVKRREKFVFVPGVVLLVGGPILVGSLSIPETIGGVVALVGFLAILASTVPLLRQSPTVS